MLQLSPIVVSRTICTCGPMTVPLPTRTFGPMTA
jgi:hypothetical protein